MALFKRLALASLFFTLSFSTHAAQTPPITVFIAKKIITMDPAWPQATAVAVENGKILSVGSLEDLKPWLSKRPYQIDKTFENKVLLPGFIEPHGHPLLGGLAMSQALLTYLPQPNPYGPGFPGVKTKAEALAKLKEYVRSAKPSTPILAWGYDIVAMGSPLDAATLDKISTTQPIIVWDASAHVSFANSAAMNLFKLSASDSQIPGVKVDKKGQLNGQFYGVPATVFLIKKAFAMTMTPQDAYKDMKYLMDLSHHYGITTTTELTFGIVDFPKEFALYNKYFNNPNTAMRLVAITDGVSAQQYKGAEALAFVKSLEKKTPINSCSMA